MSTSRFTRPIHGGYPGKVLRHFVGVDMASGGDTHVEGYYDEEGVLHITKCITAPNPLLEEFSHEQDKYTYALLNEQRPKSKQAEEHVRKQAELFGIPTHPRK